MSEYGWSNKGNSEKSPSEEVGDALSDAFDWPENAIDYMNSQNFATNVARQSCRLVCTKKCLSGCGGTFANGQWMQGHAQSVFYNERSHFQSRGDSYCLQGAGKAWCFSFSFHMGVVGSELFFDQVDDQFSDFATEDKEEIFKYTTFNRKGTHISNRRNFEAKRLHDTLVREMCTRCARGGWVWN